MMFYIKNNLNLIFIKSLLVCIVPYFLVFSIFLADLSIVILSAIFIFEIFKNKKHYITDNKVVSILIIFWIYNVILSFFSIDTFLSLKSTLFYFRFILFPLIIFSLIVEHKNFLKIFLISTSILLFILALDGCIEYIRGENFFQFKKTEFGRVASLFGDEYVYGSFFLKLFFPLASVLYFLSEPKKKKFIFFYFLLLNLFLYFNFR